MFITVFTRLATGPYSEPGVSNPHLPTYFLKSILILSPYLPSHLIPSGFPRKILYAFVIFPIRATCPALVILLNLIKVKGKVVPVLFLN
jgi:hypothetical protein